MPALHPEGPLYTIGSAAFSKFRRRSREGLAALPREERLAYARAVEAAILSSQRSSLQRELPSHAPSCASGTAYTTGQEISAAIRRRQENALLACPSKVRRKRTDDKWREMYAEAMKAKRTPTWGQIMPVLVSLANSDNMKARDTAYAELTRMAALADKYVEAMKVR